MPRPRLHRPFPAAPLIDRFPSVTVAAEVLGVSRSAIHRYMRNGLDLWRADELAIRAGLGPEQVWPDEWQDYCQSGIDED